MAIQPIQTTPHTSPPMTDMAPTFSFGNGATFDQSGKALNTQAQTDLGALGITGGSYTGYVSPVTTSSSFETKVNNLGNNIQSGLANPPITPNSISLGGSYNPSYDPNTDPKVTATIEASNKALIERQKAIEEERNATLSTLTEQFGRDKTALQETQKKETGSTNRNLLYLQQGGQSASAQAYLNSLEVSHQREMDNFTAKYNSAMQQAKNAYSAKDFELAQAIVSNANAIRTSAEKRNQDFLDNTIKIHNEIQQEQEIQYKRYRDFQADAKDALDYATKNNIQKPIFRLGGSLFYTNNGHAVNPEDVAGIDPGQIQDVLPAKTYASGIIGEYQFYSEQMQQQGLKPLDFNAYQNMDANRKRVINRTTYNITNGEDGKKEIDAVKAIIDANPNEWGKAADAINRKLGDPDAATRYDPLLKANYLLPANARKFADYVAKNSAEMSLKDWQAGLNVFIQENSYVDPEIAAGVYTKIIPKPSASDEFR